MELALFIMIGAVAVAAAAMMLISENAVHSALFLILNFACIAFLFLMLNAPFLAMVQVTVYAGAIMVLFLFVIMMLGAERVLPEREPRFPWLIPAAVVLALIFLITTSAAIIRGDIDLTGSQGNAPHVRVIHALDGIASVDVYLGETPVVEHLVFQKSTDFEAWKQGRYSLTLFTAGDDPQTATPLAQEQVDLNAGETLSLVAIGTSTQPGMVVVSEDMSSVSEGQKLRVMAVNALPGVQTIDVWDVTDARTRLIENIPYGAASESALLDNGTYDIGVSSSGDQSILATLGDQNYKSDSAVLWVFTTQHQPDNSLARIIITLKTNASASFGGPSFVGQQLFTRFVLPFEMVALVLLAAMIGAIILTKESLGKRRRVERRLANAPAGLEQPASAPAASSRVAGGK